MNVVGLEEILTGTSQDVGFFCVYIYIYQLLHHSGQSGKFWGLNSQSTTLVPITRRVPGSSSFTFGCIAAQHKVPCTPCCSHKMGQQSLTTGRCWVKASRHNDLRHLSSASTSFNPPAVKRITDKGINANLFMLLALPWAHQPLVGIKIFQFPSLMPVGVNYSTVI